MGTEGDRRWGAVEKPPESMVPDHRQLECPEGQQKLLRKENKTMRAILTEWQAWSCVLPLLVPRVPLRHTL